MAVKRRKRRGADPEKLRFWKEAVAEQAASGVSVREFCEQRGLSEPSYYAWRRRLSGNAKRRSDSGGGAAEFVPVRVITDPGTAAAEIALADGVVVRVSNGCDARTLQTVLVALENRSC